MYAAWRLGGLVAISAVIVGCGGNAGESAGTTATPLAVRASTTMTTGRLAKPRFVAQVNRLCRRAWPVILEGFNEYSDYQKAKLSGRRLFALAVRRSFLNSLDIYTFDKIRELKAPTGEKAAVEEVIGKMQAAVELGWWHVHAYSPTQLSAQFADFNQVARRYGLKECLVEGPHLPEGPA